MKVIDMLLLWRVDSTWKCKTLLSKRQYRMYYWQGFDVKLLIRWKNRFRTELTTLSCYNRRVGGVVEFMVSQRHCLQSNMKFVHEFSSSFFKSMNMSMSIFIIHMISTRINGNLWALRDHQTFIWKIRKKADLR